MRSWVGGRLVVELQPMLASWLIRRQHSILTILQTTKANSSVSFKTNNNTDTVNQKAKPNIQHRHPSPSLYTYLPYPLPPTHPAPNRLTPQIPAYTSPAPNPTRFSPRPDWNYHTEKPHHSPTPIHRPTVPKTPTTTRRHDLSFSFCPRGAALSVVSALAAITYGKYRTYTSGELDGLLLVCCLFRWSENLGG